MIDGPIYHGYTRDDRTITLHLPIQMPGFGRIESKESWILFMAWMKEEMEAHQATLRSLELALATTLDDTDNEYRVRLEQYCMGTQP